LRYGLWSSCRLSGARAYATRMLWRDRVFMWSLALFGTLVALFVALAMRS